MRSSPPKPPAARRTSTREKPLAHTIAEQQSIVRAVKENDIIWQMGSWQRSVAHLPQGGGNRPQRADRQR